MQSEVDSLVRMVTSFATKVGIEYTAHDLEEFTAEGNLSMIMCVLSSSRCRFASHILSSPPPPPAKQALI